MKFVIREITLSPNDAEDVLVKSAAKFLQINESDICSLRVVRQSIDARRGRVCLKYTAEVDVPDISLSKKLLKNGFEAAETEVEKPLINGSEELKGRIVIVGCGPCGLFAGYILSLYGYRPVMIDRGKDIYKREKDFSDLCSKGVLNTESNTCFGEGGAGAFSDGKLTTRIKDPRVKKVLEVMHKYGAPKEILYSAKPHLGTDVIRQVVKNIRIECERMGAEVMFNTRLDDISVCDGELNSVVFNNGNTLNAGCVVLASGHSARDTFEMLLKKGVLIQPKPFAVGVRAEHKREFIDSSQYGAFAGHPRLGAAEYKVRAKSGSRGVYSFCMCPGGEVVCSATEKGMNAVNGMSYSARDAENSNSAIVVSVDTADFSNHPLGGVEFQRMIEKAAYIDGYGAPVQRLEDFFADRASQGFGSIVPSYKPYTEMRNLNELMPKYISSAIADGFKSFGRSFAGFDDGDVVLTGFETRTSSPVRIMRGEDMQSVTIKNLYPAGEGAGYAGGIVSAAVDGIKIAEKIIERFKI